MVLHGTGGSGKQFLTPQFADELYGPGAPLDVKKTYVILPDAIGHGQSSKPSNGLRMAFPKYDYDDMVEGERRTLDHLGVKRLQLILGTSMGCMHAFVWGETYPGFQYAGWQAVVAPQGTPADVIRRFSADLAGVIRDPDVVKRLLDLGIIAEAGTPEQLGEFLNAEHVRWEKLSKDIGVVPE